MVIDKDNLVKEANRVIAKHKGVYIMSDEDLSFLVVG